MYPKDLRYTKDHEWIKMDGSEGAIGITHYAQEALGDIVFVELPEPDDSFDAGDVIGSIESVKAVSDILIPVGGTVTAANSALEDAPETINADPYGEGWICRIDVRDDGELEDLMDAAQYQEFLKEVED